MNKRQEPAVGIEAKMLRASASASSSDNAIDAVEISRLRSEVVRKVKEISHQKNEVASLEGLISEAITQRVNQREQHRATLSVLERELDAVRRERDDAWFALNALKERVVARAASAKSQAPAATKLYPRVISPSRDLRIAGVMDEFTSTMFAPSCRLLSLNIQDWEQQLDAFSPELLFVESAWHGNGGQWNRKINRPSRELREIVEWCKKRSIPTIFWNKEDPVHFSTFIATAGLFDHVFTTDIDCIGLYKTMLSHDRVYLFPFFGQPKLHNPIERYERKDAFCFAGAYYVRYQERQKDFDSIIDAIGNFSEIDIYDRNYGKDDPNYIFPESYQKFIRGTLSYRDIDRAYKGYAFGINLNSVKQSQTMFARRAYDLLLSNTHVVSNYSRGLRLMFGDLVTATDDSRSLSLKIAPFLEGGGNVSYRHLHRLMALRKTLQEHTVGHRIAYVCSKVNGAKVDPDVPSVVVVSVVSNDAELDATLVAYDRQTWDRKRLVVVLSEGYLPGLPVDRAVARDLHIYAAQGADGVMPSSDWAGDYVAFFSARDYYGANYLTDAALAFQYSDADVVGKGAWYEDGDSGLELRSQGDQYRYIESMRLRRAMVAASVLAGASLLEWSQGLDERSIVANPCLSIDEFSYVAESRTHHHPDLDEPQLDAGLPVASLLQHAEEIKGISLKFDAALGFNASRLSDIFGDGVKNGALRLSSHSNELLLRSSLREGEHKYLYAAHLLKIEDFCSNDIVDFNLVASPGLHLDVVLIFLSETGDKLGHAIKSYGRNHQMEVPDGTRQIRLGLRVSGPGSARISGLATEVVPEYEVPTPQFGRGRYLLVTNVYPSPSHLYRNGFVHRRALGYLDAGLRADVFVMNRTAPRSYEFDDIDVTVGPVKRLRASLLGNDYNTVLVHFLDADMWGVLKEFLPKTRVLVWIHGAEVQPWYRRDFNYTSEVQREAAKAESEKRIAFWREVMSELHPNLHFIFVSRYFADEVMEDVGVRLRDAQYSVIHNFIDTDLFSYKKKDVGQRLKVLSLRPFASRKYANDLSVRTILALREHPHFEKMEFRIIGDGELFEETLAPLRDLPNVVTEQRFLTQREISDLHQEYGVFLCPTRMDSQGVSRDEAMASGLVPVTNGVTAIPEFVDDACGIVVPGEDWAAMAHELGMLASNPERFSRMSAAAAERVRRQSGFSETIQREIELIGIATERNKA